MYICRLYARITWHILVNNNAFNEGPVINNVMDVDGDDGNNNGDINGNSEMIDLHNRRLQEERERAENKIKE